MKNLQHLTTSGFILIIASASMLFAEKIDQNNLKIIVSLLFVNAGIFSIFFSNTNKVYKIPSSFQLIQGIGLIIYPLIVLFFAKNTTDFLFITTFFILSYGLIEIFFPLFVLNSTRKVVYKPLVFRVVSGVITTVGAIILLITSFDNKTNGVIFAGCFTLLIGISNIVFVKMIKKTDISLFLK